MNNFKTGKKFLALIMAILVTFSGASVYAAESAEDENKYPDVAVCHEHIYGDWIITIQPTCKTEGKKYRKCTNCGYEESPVVMPADPNAHVPGDEVVVKAATCVSDGTSEYVCQQTGCGVKYQTTTAKLGHAFKVDKDGKVEVTVSVAPQHMYKHYANGKGFSTCNRCGVSVEQTIYVEHDFEGATPDVKKAATCKEGGYQEKMCSICQYSIREDTPVDPDAHVFSGKAQLKDGVKFDCNNDGVGIVICEVCNAIDEITIPKEKAHDYIGWTVEKELSDNAACGKYSAKGYEVRYCDVCSTELERRTIDAPHNFIEKLSDGTEISHVTASVAATCCTRGYDVGNCVDCKEKDVKNYYDIEPDVHSYIEKVITPSTCTVEGERLVLCKYDASHFKYEKIELADHVYDSKWEIKEATCSEPGYKKNHCAKCGDINIYLPIDENAHNFSGSEWSILKPSTCSEEGIAIATCNYCFKDIRKPVPLCYSTGAGFTTVEPTCYKEGTESYICTVCGLGHKIAIPKDDKAHVAAVGYKIRKQATCTEYGLETKYCAYCNADIQENQKIIPKKAHTVKEIVDEYPACAVNSSDFKTGSKHHECVDCTYVSGSVDIYAEHSFTKWDTKSQDANCLHPITIERVCYSCGLVETDNNYYGSHQETNWVFENGEKCSTGGVAVKRCPVCKEIYDKKTINAGDHTDLVFVTDKIESTATACYGNVYKCVTCAEEVVVSRPHNYMILDKGFEPTCTTSGLTDSKYCMVCKLKIEQKPIAELGHDKAYDSNGTEYCKRCKLYTVSGAFTDSCDHFCHNQGIVARVLKMLSGIFWKMFKTNHFCKCGVAHYHEEEATITFKELDKKGKLVCEYSCSECEVENKEITLK